jgi:DNA-directed RNA polymerase subunit RPC12/RpoP
MVKLGRTSEIEIDELLRKNAEDMKKLSDKVEEATSGKKKMETLLAEVEKKKAEKEEKEKQDTESHEGHDHGEKGHQHVHTLAFTEKGVGKCTGKGCLTEFSLGPVIAEDDWDKDTPDPLKYAEPGFDEKKVHNVYECTTCGNKVVGPKRKNIGVENKLSDCPFCKSSDAKFQPVDLRKLKDKIKKR